MQLDFFQLHQKRWDIMVLRRGFEPRTPCLKGKGVKNPQSRMNAGFFGAAKKFLQQICNNGSQKHRELSDDICE